MRPRSGPARLGRWLLRLRAGAERRADTEADLVELYHLRRQERGPLYAQWRWFRDVLSVPRPAWAPPPRTTRDHAMMAVLHDLRTGGRALASQPRFTAIAVVILALGIGITSAVFSVVNAVLLRPLPYPNPERLMAVTGLNKSTTAVSPSRTIALADVARWRRAAAGASAPSAIESMGAFAYTELPLQVGHRSFSPVTALVDPEFLTTLGHRLAYGTYFPADVPEAGDASVIVTDRLWRDAFGSDPDAVGRTVSVDGEPYVIRGVLPPDFQFPRSDASYSSDPVDMVMPASRLPGFPAASPQWWGLARLKPGMAPARAEAELQAIAEAVSRNDKTGDVRSVRLTPLADETTRQARQPLLVLLGIAIVLLLIAASNLMNLMFARGVGRMREMSIRRALGGTTWQIVRLLLIESLVLAALGGGLGLGVAVFAIKGVVALSPVHLPVTRAIDIDGTVVAFTILLCAVTAIVAGLVPALQVSARTSEAVRHSGMRSSDSRRVSRLQQALCTMQIAFGMTLLCAAGLLANSLRELHAVDPGFDTGQVVGFNFSVPGSLSLEDRIRFYQASLDEIRALPGVERAGLISFLPPETRAGVFMSVGIDGAPPAGPGTPAPRANTLVTSVDYFATMRMPIVRGRDFTPGDTGEQPGVVIVNEAFVRRYLPVGDPIGRRIGTGFDRLQPVRAIVGVVRDTHDRGVGVAPMPTVYLNFQQRTLPYGAIAVRTTAPATAILPLIRERVQRLNPAVPLSDFQTLSARLRESLREPRFYALLAMTCASMAVLFVTFGLYGLVSYSVGRRTTELGIRMAIGAQRSAIVRMVLGQGLRMAVIGVGLGLALAAATSSALESLLFQVRANDPATFTAAAAVVIAVTLAASYAPARRASRVDPIAALRRE